MICLDMIAFSFGCSFDARSTNFFQILLDFSIVNISRKVPKTLNSYLVSNFLGSTNDLFRNELILVQRFLKNVLQASLKGRYIFSS